MFAMRNRAQDIARRVAPFLAIVAMAIFSPGCGGEVKAQGQPEVPQPSPTFDPTMTEPPADDSALLDVLSDPPTQILLDGKPIGTSPISAHKVSPGSHDVTFVDEKTGNRTMSVKLEPGDTRTVKSDRPQTSADARPVEGGGEKK
jgi:hypothetical protein